ncbi:hypothetical protein CLG94_01925 [Candidatus Methylomirabilis limnetica]|uniref:Uncharacterized protein n=1 Tax=Candidatus Methylomirabilis limnetica TaxID=2033718 RepID=A0A2T4U0G7_9BACT|nr:hypothetical protein CLG94_01925 [Candidatus Methylomirabilis limnetica]
MGSFCFITVGPFCVVKTMQSDSVVTDLPQRIWAMITSNLERTGPTRVLVRRDSLEGGAMGILRIR